MATRNGFVMYAESRRDEFLAAGYTLERGLRDLVNLCSKDWEKLHADEKQKFAQEAKRYNAELVKRQAGKVPVPSPPLFLETGRKSRRERFEEEKLLMQIGNPDEFFQGEWMQFQRNRRIVNELFERKDWKDQPIVICSFTLYVEPGYGLMYLPAEIGLTAMSLKDGVMDNFGRIIEPGKIRRGYEGEASQNAGKLGLPKPGKHPELRSLEPLMMILVDFLKLYKGNLPRKGLHVFAFDSDYLTVKRCLDWLLKKTYYPFSYVKVLSLDQYVYLASTKASVPESLSGKRKGRGTGRKSSYRQPGKSLTGNLIYSPQHLSCAQGIFLKEEHVDQCIKDVDTYNNYDDLCCIYHLKTGKKIQNCALTVSNRFAFSLLEILTISSNTLIIPGGHPEVEKKSKLEKDRRYRMLARWGLTELEERMFRRV